MRQVVTVNAQVQWKYSQDPRSGRWIAVCDPLALTIEADTHTELRENIADAMNVLIRSMLKSGDLEEFLRDRGWADAYQTIAKAVRGDRNVFFDVPIELIAARRANDRAATVH